MAYPGRSGDASIRMLACFILAGVIALFTLVIPVKENSRIIRNERGRAERDEDNGRMIQQAEDFKAGAFDMRFKNAEPGEWVIQGLSYQLEDGFCTLRWSWPPGLQAVYSARDG